LTLEFNPTFTPYEMLELGIFDGSYYLDTNPDFNRKPTITKSNLFMEGASQPLQVWKDNGWITPEDPMGWFQWYLRYYQGRRIPELDAWQIKRWKSFGARHGAQVKKNGNGDLTKRRKQRQALLHWGFDPIPDIDAENKFEFLCKKVKLTVDKHV
jgi:hypothetical protein